MKIDKIEKLADWYIPFNKVFELSDHDKKISYESSIKDFDSQEIYFIVYFNNDPIACASIILTDDVAGLYGLAVLPEHRNKGIGSALQKFRIQEAIKLKCNYAIMLAEATSISIAEKLGFSKYCTYVSYIYNFK